MPSEIPLEIVIIIIGHAYYRDPMAYDRAPDYPTLSTCSLVAKSWTEVAQRLLFAHIQQSVAPRFADLLFPVIQDPHVSYLCGYVRIVELVVGHESHHPSLIDFLRFCPGLYDLALTIHGYLPFDLNSQHSNAPAHRNIRCLRIVSCSVRSPVLFHLLTFFPTVQFLHIHIEIAADPPEDPLPELTLHELVLQRSLPAPTLTWLLASSHDSLRVLELWDTPDVEMKAVLEPYLPQLHFLGLMHLNRTSAYVPSQSSNLKELVVLRLPVPEILSLDKILPQSLEHFGVVNEPYSEQTKVAWSPVLKVLETLPNLQFFSCDRKTARIADSNRIGEICSQRSIQLRVFPYKPDQQERWPNQDPVIGRAFPRRRSVSNILLMR